ncbi:hypothetical protein, partial [Streptomyces sp. NPDC006324]|uniref:hypothetical protein n=1 Tax=Streptomyces sp. NPDC006324 TaxID=3156751 RepID=UPI0033A59CC8
MTAVPPRRPAAGHHVRTPPPVEHPGGDTATDDRTVRAPEAPTAAGAPRLPGQGVRTGALPPLPPLDPHGVYKPGNVVLRPETEAGRFGIPALAHEECLSG